MTWNILSQLFRRLFPSRSGRPCARPSKKRSRRLELEALEDRRVLSAVVTVDAQGIVNVIDSGVSFRTIAPQSSTILIHSCLPAGTRARGTHPASAIAPNMSAAVWISV